MVQIGGAGAWLCQCAAELQFLSFHIFMFNSLSHNNAIEIYSLYTYIYMNIYFLFLLFAFFSILQIFSRGFSLFFFFLYYFFYSFYLVSWRRVVCNVMSGGATVQRRPVGSGYVACPCLLQHLHMRPPLHVLPRPCNGPTLCGLYQFSACRHSSH